MGIWKKSTMTKTSNPILFFGSGPVAAKSLRLLADNFPIEAVITKPRPPHHKGSVPVLEAATDLGLKTITAANKRDLDKIFNNETTFKSDLAILIDFGIIVSQTLIDYFRLGIINSHFSLLPQWRGADPITFSVLSGQKETGVSLMLLTAGMDEGPLLGYAPYTLPDDITTPQLTEDLIRVSNELIKVIVPKYIAGEVQAAPQDPSITPTYSRKLTKADGHIDWRKPAAVIEREIRAYAEWPKSWTQLGNLDVIITKAHVTVAKGIPGKIEISNKELLVHCAQQSLAIDKLKPAGKKEMTGESFIAGYKHLFSSAS